MNKVNK